MKNFKTYLVERELYAYDPNLVSPSPDWWGNQDPRYPPFNYPFGRPAPTDPRIPFPADSYRGPLSDPETRNLIRYIQEGGWKPGDPPPPQPSWWPFGTATWLEVFFGLSPLFINQEAGGYGDDVIAPPLGPGDERLPPKPNTPLSIEDDIVIHPEYYTSPDVEWQWFR